MYRDTDYLNYTDLNEVEERIKEQHEILECVNISTPDFHPKNWKLNDFPYIQEIDRIERGVNDLGEYYYKPNGWQECKTWLTGKETSQIIKSFSYLDINRWINNYSLMKNIFSGYKFEKINGTKIKINSLINQKAKSLTIEGKSEQDGTPTPDYPSEIKNIDGIRNLCNNNYTKGQYNGNTFNANDDRYTTDFIEVSPNTKYTFSLNSEEKLASLINLNYFDKNKTWLGNRSTMGLTQFSTTDREKTITTTNNTYYIRWTLRPYEGLSKLSYDSAISQMSQFQIGNKTNYVPYGSNYLPIVNTGKNKFDGEYELGTINFDTGQLETNTNIIRTKNYQTIIENENYSLSLPLEVTGIILYYYKNGVFVKANQPVINNHSVSFTASSNANQLKWRFNSGYTTLDNETQLEEGNATNYEPYRKQTTLIDLKGNELCSIGDVKDELSIKNGKAKINKRFGKIVLNGSETWSYINNYDSGNMYRFMLSSLNYKTNTFVLSDKFKNDNIYDTKNENIYVHPTQANNIAIFIKGSRLSDISTTSKALKSFKTWLSTHPVEVEYELAEPYEIELDDCNIELFDGVNNISLVDDLDTNMECEYIKEIGDYTTIWNLQSFMNWNESSNLEWSDE